MRPGPSPVAAHVPIIEPLSAAAAAATVASGPLVSTLLQILTVVFIAFKINRF